MSLFVKIYNDAIPPLSVLSLLQASKHWSDQNVEKIKLQGKDPYAIVSSVLREISAACNKRTIFKQTMKFSRIEVGKFLEWFILNEKPYSGETLNTSLLQFHRDLEKPGLNRAAQSPYIEQLLMVMIETSRNAEFIQAYKMLGFLLTPSALSRLTRAAGVHGEQSIFELLFDRGRFAVIKEEDCRSVTEAGHLPTLFPSFEKFSPTISTHHLGQLLEWAVQADELPAVEFLIEQKNNALDVLDQEETLLDHARECGAAAVAAFLEKKGQTSDKSMAVDENQSNLKFFQDKNIDNFKDEKGQLKLKEFNKFLEEKKAELSLADRTFILEQFFLSEGWKKFQQTQEKKKDRLLEILSQQKGNAIKRNALFNFIRDILRIAALTGSSDAFLLNLLLFRSLSPSEEEMGSLLHVLKIVCRLGEKQMLEHSLRMLWLSGECKEKLFKVALRYRQLEIVKILFNVDVSIEPTIKVKANGERKIFSPLSIAALSGSLKIVEYLVKEKKADVNFTHELLGYYSPLDFAIMGGNEEVFNFLRARRASSMRSDIGRLAIALQEGHLWFIKRFFEENASAGTTSIEQLKSSKNRQGLHQIFRTPLSVATKFGHFEIVKWLVENQEANLTNANSNNSPLILAAQNEDSKILMYLFSKMEELGKLDFELKIKILETAVKAGSIRNVAFLFAKKVPMNDNLLILAAKHACGSMVEFLLDRGISIHATLPSTGDTALHMAAVQRKEGIVNLVAYLLHRGADVRLRNKEDQTPLQKTVHRKSKSHQMTVKEIEEHQMIVELLIFAGANEKELPLTHWRSEVAKKGAEELFNMLRSNDV
jgi:ankyrin repeat protein